MRIFPVLLRLLLCLALVASGVAGARAQARMQVESHAMTAMTAMADLPDCHDAAPPEPLPASHHDCCDAGPCACPVPAMPVFTGLRLAAASPDAVQAWSDSTPRHRAPRLGDPLRPPIG